MKTEDKETAGAKKMHAHQPVPDPKFLLPSTCTTSINGGPKVTTVYQRCGLCGRIYAWR